MRRNRRDGRRLVASVGVAAALVVVSVAVGAVAMAVTARDTDTTARREPVSVAVTPPDRLGPNSALQRAASAEQALDTPANLGPGARMVLFGDSVADTVSWGLIPEAARRGASVNPRVVPGCSTIRGTPLLPDGSTVPWADNCEAHLPMWLGEVASAPADTVLWLSTWDTAIRGVDGIVANPATPEGRAIIADLTRQTADVIAPPGSGRRIVFLLAAPPSVTPRGAPNPDIVTAFTQYKDVLELVVQSDRSRFSLLPLARFVCPAGPPCPELATFEMAPRADDGGHFTRAGSDWVAPLILDALGV